MGERDLGVGVNTPRVSVIIVSSGNVYSFRRSVESVLSQDYPEVECLPIVALEDVASAEVALSFGSHVSRMHRYEEGNLYRGMNEVIASVSSEWICIFRSGDRFASRGSISAVFARDTGLFGDVIYGDSVSVLRDGTEMYELAEGSSNDLANGPFYYLGAAFTRARTVKDVLYDESCSSSLGNMLDYVLEFGIHANGGTFLRVPAYVTKHPVDPPFSGNLGHGICVARVSGRGIFKARVKRIVSVVIKSFSRARLDVIVRPSFHFVERYLTNYVVQIVPVKAFRTAWLRMLGAHVGKKTEIDMRLYTISPRKLIVGNRTHINRGAFFDARGTIHIGDSVSISHNVSVITGSHDIQSPSFTGLFKPVRIRDYAFIGANATILQGVTIGEGAVVAAGAVITKDVPEYEVHGGNPARRIGSRERGLSYKCESRTFFS